MEIKFQSKTQSKIADLMWNAKDMNEVNKLLTIFGKDGYIVYNMILAHTFDEVMDTDIASNTLKKIFYK